MLRLYYSNRLEDLLAPLAESVRAQQVRDPLEPVTIVVPGRVMAQYVKFELAERLGVAANLRFPFLHDHLAGLIRKVAPGVDVLDRRRLELLLYQRLGRGSITEASDMAPVQAYLGLAASPSDRYLRRLQLARELSGLFLEYAFSRRELIAGWRGGPQLAGTSYREPERWQRALWRSIFDERGALAGPAGSSASRWQLLPDAFEEIPAEKFGGMPPLHLFGLFYLAPAFASVFSKLAARGEVRVFSTVPCLEGEPPGADPAELAREDQSRAVTLWARPGREYFRILNSVCGPERHPCFRAPATGRGETLLGRIQGDILQRRREALIEGRAPADAPDGSIRFLACPGIRREAEIVAARIWSLIGASPRRGRERLRFHEIAVLIPEGAEASYVPHLQAAFRELREIPVNLLSSPGSDNRLGEAVEDLLALPLGRFGKEEMVRLLTHPCVGESSGKRDRDRWREWCDDLRIVFGADRNDLRGTFIYPLDLYNWDQGLRRLALGAFMAGDPSGAGEVYGEGDRACVPWEVPQGEASGAARFLSLARRLLSDARSIAKAELRPAEWVELLSGLVRTYVQPSTDAEFAARQACLDAISEIAVEVEHEVMPYEVAHALVTDMLSDAQSRSRRFTRGGVAVGTLRSMRTVPFRVIFVMGLGESVFPAQERGDLLDLRGAERRAGDASVAERDRYLFLETLLAARDRLFLSYVARDARTGEKLEPSTVIRELQFLLREYVPLEEVQAMTEEFPVTRYGLEDPAREPIADPGADLAALRGGRFRALGADLRRHLGGSLPPDRETILQGVDEMPDAAVRERLRSGLRLPSLPDRAAAKKERRRIDMPLAALRKFLECPLQGAAQYALRISEDDLEGGTETEEPLEGRALDRTVLARDAFRDHAGDPRAAGEAFVKAHRRAVLLGTAPAGPFGDAERTTVLEAMGSWTENAAHLGLGDLACWGAMQIGRAHESAVVREPLPPIVIEDLEIPRPGHGVEKINVRLHGATELVSPDYATAVRCVLKRKDKVKEYDYLPLYLTAIALAAAGLPTPDSFRAVILTGDKPRAVDSERRMSAMTAGEARDYLGRLVADLLSGSHAYFLPFEAVLKARFALANSSVAILPLVEELRQDEWKRCRSDYGPVRVPRRFPPPSEQEARRMIEHRFGPLFARILSDAPRKRKKA